MLRHDEVEVMAAVVLVGVPSAAVDLPVLVAALAMRPAVAEPARRATQLAHQHQLEAVGTPFALSDLVLPACGAADEARTILIL